MSKKDGRGRPSKEFTEEEVKKAIAKNRYLYEAASELKISYPTFLKEKERLGLGSIMQNNTEIEQKLELEQWDNIEEFIKAMEKTDEQCVDSVGYEDVYININERCVILPWGDWHVGGSHTRHTQLSLDTKFIQQHSNIYVVLMGDYCDNFIKTSHGGGVYEQVLPTSKQKQRVEYIVTTLKDRILGVVMGCFLKGTPIVSNDYTLKSIEKIEKVLGSDKGYDVKKHWQENYHNGDICRIKYMGNTVFDIPATNNHPFLALKKKDLKCIHRYEKNRSCKGINRSSICDNNTCYKYKEIVPKMIKAGNLDIGDFVYIPKAEDPKGNRFTNEDMKIFGWYLAEGSSGIKRCCTEFNFGIKDLEYAKEIQKIIEKNHSDKISSTTLKIRKERNTAPLYVYGKRFARWIQKYCGRYSDKKKIHIDVINESNEHLSQLIDSFRLGDGHTRKQGIDLCTTSKDLAFQLWNILLRIGNFSTISALNRTNRKRSYNIHYHIDKNKFFYCETKKGYFTPITSIEKEYYEGEVKNLWIDSEEHLYRAGGLAVGNCHDKWMFDNEGFDFAQFLAKKTKGSWLGLNALLHVTVGKQEYPIYVSHKYQRWSRDNPCHGLFDVYRNMKNFEIIFGAHRHMPAIAQQIIKGNWVTAIRSTAYKITDYFLSHKNLPRSPYYLPCVLLDPDEHSVVAYKDIWGAIKHL